MNQDVITALLSELEKAEKDQRVNAPWLSVAHTICYDNDIPKGHISDRLEALRDKITALESELEKAERNKDKRYNEGYDDAKDLYVTRITALESERDRYREALERIATSTMSQHLNKETMIVDLQVLAREALVGGTE